MAEINTISELVEMIRSGKQEGTIEITVNTKGKTNRIIIRSPGPKEELENSIEQIRKKVTIDGPVVGGIDFSHTNVSGSDFSGLDLRGSNFSYSRVDGSDLSGAYVTGANFYKAHISETNLYRVHGANLYGSVLTGSANLYGANEPLPEIVNPIDAAFSHGLDHHDYPM